MKLSYDVVNALKVRAGQFRVAGSRGEEQYTEGEEYSWFTGAGAKATTQGIVREGLHILAGARPLKDS